MPEPYGNGFLLGIYLIFATQRFWSVSHRALGLSATSATSPAGPDALRSPLGHHISLLNQWRHVLK
jgi:hypothetical protein